MNDLFAFAAARAAAEAEDPQRGAADPKASVWVAASAGTGKTKVLTDRVLRLLLGGTEPQRILCLTYTKAAAAEMSTRIAEDLGRWAIAADPDLGETLAALLGRVPTRAERARARQLFARVLDAPGGLHIETIHAFCNSLLGRFPLEAGVAPHFTLMDESTSQDLLAQARHAVLEQAGRDGGGLGRALAGVTLQVREQGFGELMAAIAGCRTRLADLLLHHGSVSAAAAALRRHLGLGDDEMVETIVAAACADGAFDAEGLRLAARTLAEGGDGDAARGMRLGAWLAADPAARAAGFDDYRCLFLTGDDDDPPKPRAPKFLLRKALSDRAPAAAAAMQAEAERLVRVCLRRRAALSAQASADLLTLADALLRAYQRLKHSRSLLDYEDLIQGAARLLGQEDTASWVLYKLDGGIEHLLIDEAQDTSPAQWRIVENLTAEFFAGEGAQRTRRTIFAVGDVKQSIYSFQGADPAAFVASRDHYARRVPAAGHDWRPIDLTTSFRSTRAVLAAVDATFADPALARSISFDVGEIVHRAHRKLDGGLVEVWPPIEPRSSETPEPWAPPTTGAAADSPQARLARLVALRIEAMLSGEVLESEGRRIGAGDIMVLVRSRTEFMPNLVRALKERHLPVAGIDRMLLTEQLAVMDLVALGRFALLPDDDLTLATVLKGPLLGFDEDRLFALAHGRPGSLWSALRARAATDEGCARALAYLTAVRATADRVPPFEFFMRILGPGRGDRASGREKLLARLGRDAEDPLAELLELALGFERTHPPSLLGFLHWLETYAVEITRDPEQGRRDAVRVMTVHGAKGLQSPIVVLPGPCKLRRPPDKLLWPDSADGPLLLWPPRRAFCESVAEAERARVQALQRDEYRRLLYVAMTRARDRLIVCGWLDRNQKEPDDECWLTLVRRGLEAAPAALGVEAGEDPFLAAHPSLIDRTRSLRLSCPQQVPAAAAPSPPAPTPEPLPDWARRPAPDEPAPLRPLRPSHGRDEEPTVLPPLPHTARLVRGRLIHRLLQALPEVEPSRRRELAARLLSAAVPPPGEGDAARLVDEVCAILDDPRFAAVFGPGSRAEVPLSGTVGGRVVAGQVDRLLVGAGAVTVLDFKSDRPAPRDPAAVAPVYLRQMAAYRALLRRIYPGREVGCVLLWTEEPRAMPLPAALLDGYSP